MSNPVARIYFGVPRFVGELFTATKTPTIILLIGFLGIPLAISIYLFVYGSMYHSARPAQLFVVGFAQVLIESNPQVAQSLPPNIAALMQAATEADKQLGKHIFAGLFVLGLIDVITATWWLYRAFRFLEQKARG